MISLGGNDLSERSGFSVSRAPLEEFKSIGLFWDGGTKYLQAQLSIAYATDEIPLESWEFIPNEWSQHRMSV